MAKLRSWAFLVVGLVASGSVFAACSDDAGVTPEVDLDSGTAETSTDDTSTTNESGGDTTATTDGTSEETAPNTDAPGTDGSASDAPKADAPGADTAPTSFMIACGPTPCDSRTKECCVTVLSSTCVDKGGACAGGARLSCSTRDNCTAGQFCCATTAGVVNVTGASCKAACAAMEEQLCNGNEDCMGTKCNQTIGAYKACN